MEQTAGPFTAEQAWAAGFTRSDVRRFVRCGQWILLRRGVYITASALACADGDATRRLALDVAALRLALEWDAVAGGTTAARLWGFELLPTPVQRMLVVVTDDPGAVARSRSDYVVRTAALPVDHRAIRHQVPVTSAARTALDLARTSTFVRSVVALDSALRQRLVTVSELEAVLADCAHWPGVERARRAVEFADVRSESVLESLSRVAMHEQGIARPRTQVVIGDARVDFFWDEVRVVGEADGLGKYEGSGARTTREIVRAEKRREERLTDAGFEVVRWGWEDARNPARLARRLRAAFERGVERQRGRTAA